MLYIKICTIWYISCDIYHGVYGIYESKVVYTMTQPSRCLSPVQWLRLLRPPRVCGRERWLVTDDLDSYTLRQASPSGSRWTKQSMPTARGRGPPPYSIVLIVGVLVYRAVCSSYLKTTRRDDDRADWASVASCEGRQGRAQWGRSGEGWGRGDVMWGSEGVKKRLGVTVLGC